MLFEATIFDIDGLTAGLKENGIEPSNVKMERDGAIGRFRMRAVLMLRSHARKAGFVVIEGKKLHAPGAKKRGVMRNQRKLINVRSLV